jgi:hypothetical protein
MDEVNDHSGIPRDAKHETTAPVVSVSMAEALERLLPYCDNNPHKVAARLDAQHREGDVRLLGGDVAMAPGANPAMLGIAAHIPPDGRAVLYIQVRKALAGDYPIWDGETVTSLSQHHQFWAFERENFDAHFPGEPIPDKPIADKSIPDELISDTPIPDEPKNRGGRPPDFEVIDLLTEALVYVGVAGKLPKTAGGEGGLREKLKQRLGPRCPGRTRFNEIFGPIYQRIQNERPPRHIPPIGD